MLEYWHVRGLAVGFASASLDVIKLWQRESRPGVEAMRHCIMMPVCDLTTNARPGLLAF
jgi:hypothetical protein